MTLIIAAEMVVNKPERGSWSLKQNVCERTFALFLAALIGIGTLTWMPNATWALRERPV